MQAKDRVSPRELQKLVGLINSLALVLGSRAYIKMKPLFHAALQVASGKKGWDRKFRMPPEVLNCINFWIFEFQSTPAECNLEYPDTEVVIFSDASGTGGAAFKDQDPAAHLATPISPRVESSWQTQTSSL